MVLDDSKKNVDDYKRSKQNLVAIDLHCWHVVDSFRWLPWLMCYWLHGNIVAATWTLLDVLAAFIQRIIKH